MIAPAWRATRCREAGRVGHGLRIQATGDLSFVDAAWLEAARAIVKTFREQQRFEGVGPYRFQRLTELASDTLPLGGVGYPVKPCGLIYSAFRPSDDACLLHFLVPSNYFAVAALRQLADVLDAAGQGAGTVRDARALAAQVAAALATHATFEHPRHGRILAYEVDGFGGHIAMDDANIPSLLALPYLGCVDASDPLYVRTREFVLSPDNPFYYRVHASGVMMARLRAYRARRRWDVLDRLSLTAARMSTVAAAVLTPGTSKGDPSRGLGTTANESPPRRRMRTASPFDWFRTCARFCLAWE